MLPRPLGGCSKRPPRLARWHDRGCDHSANAILDLCRAERDLREVATNCAVWEPVLQEEPRPSPLRRIARMMGALRAYFEVGADLGRWRRLLGSGCTGVRLELVGPHPCAQQLARFRRLLAGYWTEVRPTLVEVGPHVVDPMVRVSRNQDEFGPTSGEIVPNSVASKGIWSNLVEFGPTLVEVDAKLADCERMLAEFHPDTSGFGPLSV